MRAHLPRIDPYVVAIQQLFRSDPTLSRPPKPTQDVALRLQRLGCLLLHQFTCCDDDDVDLSNTRRQRVADAGSLQAVVAAMDVYKLVQWRLGQAACMVLYNSCGGSHLHDECPNGESIRERAAQAGAIESAVDFLRLHSQCSQCAKGDRTHVCGVPPEDWATNTDVGLRVLINMCTISRTASNRPTCRAEALAAATRARRAKEACDEEDVLGKIQKVYAKNPKILQRLQGVQETMAQSLMVGRKLCPR
eukprot:5926513-Prymnesium_polylepis.1